MIPQLKPPLPIKNDLERVTLAIRKDLNFGFTECNILLHHSPKFILMCKPISPFQNFAEDNTVPCCCLNIDQYA
jgi:hypothetical protein